MKDTIIYYEPNTRSRIGLFKTLYTIIRNVIQSRELLYQLYRRDFLMMYKKSFFGMGWLIFAPIIGIISWVVMNAAGVLSPGETGVPYPVYVLLGTSFWGLFMNLYNNIGKTLQVAQSFIQQVNFHHETLIFKQALQDLTNFTITLIVNIIVMFIFKVTPTWYIFLTPFLLLPIFFLAGTIGIIISVLNTLTTDIQRIATFFLTLLMFITPVIYDSSSKELWLQKLNLYNPLTYIVTGPRELLLYGSMENPQFYLYSIVFAFVLFVLALRFFYVAEKKIIEKLI